MFRFILLTCLVAVFLSQAGTVVVGQDLGDMCMPAGWTDSIGGVHAQNWSMLEVVEEYCKETNCFAAPGLVGGNPAADDQFDNNDIFLYSVALRNTEEYIGLTGDFNLTGLDLTCDQQVDFSDLLVLQGLFPGVPIPEPSGSTLSLASLFFITASLRKKNRRTRRARLEQR